MLGMTCMPMCLMPHTVCTKEKKVEGKTTERKKKRERENALMHAVLSRGAESSARGNRVHVLLSPTI